MGSIQLDGTGELACWSRLHMLVCEFCALNTVGQGWAPSSRVLLVQTHAGADSRCSCASVVGLTAGGEVGSHP